MTDLLQDAEQNAAWLRHFASRMPVIDQYGLVFSAALLDQLRADVERLRKSAAEFRDAVLHDRHQFERPCLDSDQTNAVLALFDDMFAAALNTETKQ